MNRSSVSDVYLLPQPAMSSNDVRDILNITSLGSTAGSQATGSSRRTNPTVRRPDGISRELYALIGNNSPFLSETQAALATGKYRDRPRLKQKESRWYVTTFSGCRVLKIPQGSGRIPTTSSLRVFVGLAALGQSQRRRCR